MFEEISGRLILPLPPPFPSHRVLSALRHVRSLKEAVVAAVRADVFTPKRGPYSPCCVETPSE
jgi:hypothetical protein